MQVRMKKTTAAVVLAFGLSQHGAAAPLFPDVPENHWASDAVAALAAKGLVEGYPDGTFKGNIALTRYEAAALLNACLDRVTEITEELKRLMKEFEKELVVLKARVDGLEAQTAELAATQFSTTTKLSGVAFFWLGGAVYNDSGKSPVANSGLAAAEITAYQDAIENNGLAMAPGGQLSNFNTARVRPVALDSGGSVTRSLTTYGFGKLLTKGATWSGATGTIFPYVAPFNQGGVNINNYTGDPTTLRVAPLDNIVVASTFNSDLPARVQPGFVFLDGLSGGAASGAGNNGQLFVDGLRGNGDNFGSLGFSTNDIPEGIGLTPGFVTKNASPVGLTSAGVSMAGFKLDSTDLANLIRLGNASRRVKGAPMIGYQSNVVSANLGGPQIGNAAAQPESQSM